jgi:F0F1-type ATP synthase gamma subunit
VVGICLTGDQALCGLYRQAVSKRCMEWMKRRIKRREKDKDRIWKRECLGQIL